MSTNYYHLREPITNLRMTPEGLEVSIRGQVAGLLALEPEASSGEIALMFADEQGDDSRCPMRTLWGGTAQGCIVRENTRGLDPALVLVSEYGEIFTVAQVRAFAGAGKFEHE